jgi:hypothetical protein
MITQSPRYLAFEPGAELSGKSAQALTSCIIHTEIEAILVRHNLNNIDVDAWYPVQAVLDVFSDLAATGSHVKYFLGIGMAGADNLFNNLPPWMEGVDLLQILCGYEQFYKARHRSSSGGNTGYIKAEQVEENHIIARIRVPYPDDVYYGLIYGLARHFRPADKDFEVYYDVYQPRREQGGSETVIHIRIDPPHAGSTAQ